MSSQICEIYISCMTCQCALYKCLSSYIAAKPRSREESRNSEQILLDLFGKVCEKNITVGHA